MNGHEHRDMAEQYMAEAAKLIREGGPAAGDAVALASLAQVHNDISAVTYRDELAGRRAHAEMAADYERRNSK